MINFFNRSLVHRMTALILLGAGLVMLLVIGFTYFSQRQSILASTMQQSDTLTQSAVFQIAVPLVRAEAVVQQTALLLAEKQITRAESTDIIRRTLECNPDLLGMAIALNEKASEKTDFKILYGWSEDAAIKVQDRNAGLDYQQDWFYLPYHLQHPIWTEPYYDFAANTLMVTYSFPILRSGEVFAVVTCDLSLKWLHKLLDTLPLGKGGTAILFSQRGTYISNPIRAYEMTETVFSMAESQTDPEMSRSMHQLGLNLMSGQSGVKLFKRPIDNQMAFMHYRPVPATGWVLGLIQPRKQVLAPLVRLNQISALICIAGLALLLLPALGIAWSVTRPLHRLANAANQLAAGNFDSPLPDIRSRDEVARLTGAFDKMRQDLRRYIADLTSTTAAKERIAGELSAAREIQMSIVPKLFPAFPNRPEIDLYAILFPAREVGGDLYDFMLLDEDHLYLGIGDVSGKGVPASLMMAVGKTLLKSTMQTVRAPERALTQVNNELSEGNESCMFITMFCGVLNIKTGALIYANAGHNPPFLKRQGGEIERINSPPGPALGIVNGFPYQAHSVQLSDMDLLILYTDGVTEAMNPCDIMFEEDGLLEHIRNEGHQTARLFLESLGTAVRSHAAEAEQSDDITALAVRYRAKPVNTESPTQAEMATELKPDAILRLQNNMKELNRMTTWIEEQGERFALPPPLLMTLNLVLEEWIVNVFSYAYADKSEHTVELRLWYDSNELRFEIDDDGQPFDPTGQAEADTTLPIEHRKIGGLGIHFIRKTMDRFTYRRDNGRNIVTIVKNISGKQDDPEVSV